MKMYTTREVIEQLKMLGVELRLSQLIWLLYTHNVPGSQKIGRTWTLTDDSICWLTINHSKTGHVT